MLSTKKSAQTPVFIAFFPFITIPTEKSGLKKGERSKKVKNFSSKKQLDALHQKHLLKH